MLDVHAPDHKPGGFRDFVIHILTITVGLLIALGLEATVEALHHRHQRIEADETIRQELRENRDALSKARTDMKTELQNLVRVLDFLEARSKGQPGDAKDLTLAFHEGPLQDSAWRTAASTGVLNYMDYAQVQKYALAYKEQDQFEAMERETLDEYLQLDAYVIKGFNPETFSPDDVKTALPDVRRAIAHVGGMMDITRGTLQAYDEALK